MERRRDHLRSPRPGSRVILVPPIREVMMIKRSSTSLPNLSRRGVLVLGATAGAGALAGLSPRPAAAVVKLDVTQGHVQPRPVAPPDFLGSGPPHPRPRARAAPRPA